MALYRVDLCRFKEKPMKLVVAIIKPFKLDDVR